MFLKLESVTVSHYGNFDCFVFSIFYDLLKIYWGMYLLMTKKGSCDAVERINITLPILFSGHIMASYTG